MTWPPVKAWTSKISIKGQIHFVAINYGGRLSDRWVVLMSVLDSSVLVKVSWLKLVDSSNWVSGWDENNHSDFSELANNKIQIRKTSCNYLSSDSGLTIPITENIIRPWFSKN